MKKHHFFFFLAMCSVTLFACKEDEETGTVTINFKAVYDGEPLKTFETVPFENGQQMQFTHISMYVADLALAKSSGTEVLRDIELVDLTFDNDNAAASGYTMTFNDVPAGSYAGLGFGIGVPQDLNAMEPADFPSSSPLSKTGYYWIGWQSYIFSKTEGRLDTLNNGNFDLGYALHTGSDDLYSFLEAALPITVEDGKSLTLDVVVDYKLLLQGIDIKGNPQNHNPADLTNIAALVNNLPNALTLYQ